MRRIALLSFTVALLLAAAPWASAAIEVAGVAFADQARVGDSELRLNGAGVRAKFIFKVYAMGIYVAQKQGSAAELLAAKGAKRIQIVCLLDLPGEDFAKALIAGIEKNYSGAQLEQLKARSDALQQTILALKLAPKGSLIQLDWLPGIGTRLLFNGDKRGEDYPGEDFYQALLNIWLGEHPAAQDLKDALLGKKG